MLTKKQLLDAVKCDATCQNCSLIRVGEYKSDCIPEIAQTALAYREMLERARKTLQDAWEDEGSTTVGKQILETINAIDALLGGEKDA